MNLSLTDDDPSPSEARVEDRPAGDDATALPRLIKRAVPFAIVGLFVMAVGATLYLASELFLPIFFALFLSIILHPFVRTLKRLGLPNAIGGFVAVAILIAGVGAAAVQLSAPASQWIDDVPAIVAKFERKLFSLRQSLEDAKVATEKIEEMTEPEERAVAEVKVRGPSLIEQLANYTWLTFAQILVTLALLYMFLAQGESTARRLVRKLHWRRYRMALVGFLDAVEEKFSSYVRTLTLINVCVGCATGLAMFAIGLPNAAMWGVLAAVLGFLPYLGPFVMMIILAIAGLATFETWYMMAAPSAAFMAINAIESYGVTPVVLGRSMTLSPINVFLSMLFWTWVWGMPGALLSVPIAALIKLVYDHALMLQRGIDPPDPGRPATP